MRIRTAAIAASLTLLVSATASAFVPTPKGERELETSDTILPGRTSRKPVRVAPASAQVALERVRAIGLERLLWDPDTATASQLWGSGVPAPGVTASASVAESTARAFLAEHVELLAPGSSANDFVLVSNVARDTMRAVGFAQYANGVPVEGGQVGFVFRHDRLVIVNSTALPNVKVPLMNTSFTADLTRATASHWIYGVTGTGAKADAVEDVVVLPIVRPRTARGVDIEYRLVHPVQVDLVGAVGAWTVYVDATDATPVARKNQIRYATGTVSYHVPDRYPGSTYSDYPAANANHQVNGGPVTSDASGQVSWGGTAAATVSPGLVGPRVRMHNQAGSLATTSLTLPPNGTAVWDESASEARDAQLTSFIHANIVKAYVKDNISQTLNGWIDSQLDVYVNEGGNCNAYSTGDDIHFFPADNQCENTGRIADVVYHEFGHSVHAHAIIDGVGSFAGDVSEGISDFLAATITGDPGMGRGFFYTNSALRHLDPPGSEKVYPDDVVGQVHADGEIIGQALFDLRKALIAQLGEPEGKALAERIWFHILEVSVDLPSTYAAALEADDDDGNLGNGTPHQCTIQQAFGLHGLADNTAAMLGIGTPTTEGLAVTVPVMAPSGGGSCPPPDILTANLVWQVRGSGTPATVAMTETDLGGGETEWTGTIPPQADTTVVNYKVEMSLSDGSIISYPDNAADPMYELYVGLVEPIWCDDFEAFAADWTHGADAGTDEWVAGIPMGLGGDPLTAYGGSNVFGTDLASNGEYRRDTAQWARTPVIDVTGREGVRLQYRRWLGVEDGFFDTAAILVDGNPRWSNLDSMQGNGSNTQHIDKEWRFQDVDLAADAADGTVQIEFRLESDPGLQFAGWNLDDVCVVSRVAGGVCGDGIMAGAEQCDDGNTADGDGCSATCTDETGGDDDGPGMEGGCCSTGSDPTGPALLGLMTLGLVIRRRRR
jgi:MYXO-CTERM domain-containing protein